MQLAPQWWDHALPFLALGAAAALAAAVLAPGVTALVLLAAVVVVMVESAEDSRATERPCI